mmetsp:Transcript_27723/g.39368  ORF Transcript_27723/g.39368 Transcript_27723/m.39368 type:complete len:1805 (+) Transcript_27723:293-5707(+)
MGNVLGMVCGTDSNFTSASASCSHRTIIDGNALGGYFIVGTSALLPFDISATAMQTELQLLTGMGNVSVSRSGPDNQLGYTWTITWLTVSGNVPQLQFSNSLTGSAATVKGATVQDGNTISGKFALSYYDKITSYIAWNASSDTLQAALQQIVGSVSVYKTVASTEGGSSYLVTFNELSGDIPLVVPLYSKLLSGVGAVIKVFEKVKGSLALGNSLKLSFLSPLHCSHSQVPSGQCGAPISEYLVSIGDTAASTDQNLILPVDYTIQKVRLAAPSLYDVVYFVGEDATGYFQLAYNLAVTGPISAHASAQDLRDALEALPDVQTVSVSRSYSQDLLSSSVQASQGSHSLQCPNSGPSCQFETLTAGDLVSVQGSWYRVASSFRGSAYQLPLALANDSTILTSYVGSTSSSASVYRWARGFEWTITFLSVSTSAVSPLTSPLSGLNPASASVSIRADDCVNCMYISGLSVLTKYYLHLKAVNSRGFGAVQTTTGVPLEIPAAPNSVSVISMSGSQLLAYFSPPSGVISDITQYTIQWDTNADFTHVANGSPSCSSVGYGSCELQGAAINVVPPFSYHINYLTIQTIYYVRVAARNAVSQVSSADTTRWSQVASAVTANQPPTAPVSVRTIVSGLQSLQVLIVQPVSNGGVPITAYLIEWDASAQFDDPTTYGSTTQLPADLPLLQMSSTTLVYELTGLTTGVSYYVRVSAKNSIRFGGATTSAYSSTPAGKPSNPASVTLTTAKSQSTSITSTNVSWVAPSGSFPNGGSAITGYNIEWWEAGSVAEVQAIQFKSKNFPNPSNGQFNLRFGPKPGVVYSTGNLNYQSNSFIIRSELMDLGYATTRDDFNYDNLIGDVSVSRSSLPGLGYQWLVTFNSELNQGNQVSLKGNSLASTSAGETVEVFEVVKGQRSFGLAEVQILQVLSLGSTDPLDLGGWFRLAFNGSQSLTAYLPVNASELQLKHALEELSTLRSVNVHKATVQSSLQGLSVAGFQWTVTFLGDVGDQPALQLDSSLLYTSKTAVQATVFDGDNTLGEDGSKLADTYPGEAPKNYNIRSVGADVRSFTISGLVPGNTYYVAVSAVNAYGTGSRTLPSPVASTTLSKQAPQPPAAVSVGVHAGSSTALDVTFSAPLSDGGAQVLSYRVELDISTRFLNPIYTVIPCAAGSTHSVFQIKTAGLLNDPLVGGYYSLTLSRNRATFTTDPIPFDATATRSEEAGLLQLVTGTSASLSNHSAVVTATFAADKLIFPGDRLSFDHALQLHPQEVFTVLTVLGTSITLTSPVLLAPSSASPVTSQVFRFSGGRGTTLSSKVACTSDSALCPPSRLQQSGSIQSKLESIPEALTLGVSVDRNPPDASNGIIYRVTFLDASLKGSLNFDLSVTANSQQLVTASGAAGTVTVTKLSDGVAYSNCVGTHTVPADKALATGMYYFARVFAVNEIGYSLPQVSASSQKPQVVPGPPTSVALSVVSATELRVVFNPPASDGGDAISSYRVDYSIHSDFSGAQSQLLQHLSGGAPFFKTISGLATGVPVYVRVSAANSQGFGAWAASIPSSLNPYQSSGAPSSVLLRATSSSMLTVSFGYPLSDGGDVISKYRVEWDVAAGFNSLLALPNKGYVELDATLFASYTVSYLTAGQIYYFRVFAINSAGLGTPALASPASLAPSLQVPGRPHTIQALPGLLAGTITLSWQRPRVPAHGIPCSGIATLPNDCPAAVGGGLPQSDGGVSISEYEVEANDQVDFSGFDSTTVTTTATSYNLAGLTPGRTYFIRVLARNAQGAGSYCAYSEPNCLVVSNHVQVVATPIAA